MILLKTSIISLRMKSLLLIIIAIVFLGQSTFSQKVWERMDNEKSFYGEDIIFSKFGTQYISVYGRNIILAKNKSDKNWHNLSLKDDIGYKSWDDSKSLFVDYNDSLVQFFYSFGFIFPRKYDGEKFITDSLVHTKYADIGNRVFHDSSGNYYCIDFNRIKNYINPYFDSKVIFNKDNKIIDVYFYSNDNNCVITQRLNGTYDIFKLNTITNSAQMRLQFYYNGMKSGVVACKNGNVLVSSVDGLILYRDRSSVPEYVFIDSTTLNSPMIQHLAQTKTGLIIVKAADRFYCSSDFGEQWTRLYQMEKNFPKSESLVKIEIYDSCNALLLTEPFCDLKYRTYILENNSNGWQTVDGDISSLSINNLTITKSGVIYANVTGNCEVVVSKDNSNSWNHLMIEGDGVRQVVEYSNDKLFAISNRSKRLFYSENDFETTIELKPELFGKPGLIFIYLKALPNKELFLTSAITNPATGQILEYFYFKSNDGVQWRELSKNVGQFLSAELTFDPKNGKIYSFVPLSEYKVKSAFWGNLEQSIEEDKKFEQFGKIYSMVANDSGKVFINAYLDKKLNVYESDENMKFHPFGNNIYERAIIFPMKKLRKNHLAFIRGYDGAFLSADGGKSWEDINEGLNLDSRREVGIVTDLYLDEHDFGYVSLDFDGLYRSVRPLVKNEVSTANNGLKLYYDSFTNRLKLDCNRCAFNFEGEMVVYDIMGRVVEKCLIQHEYQYVEIGSTLASAPYFYLLLGKDNTRINGTFFKYY